MQDKVVALRSCRKRMVVVMLWAVGSILVEEN